MERLGHQPRLANPLEAKRRMGLTKKTDKLDAKGLAILLRNGTLPEVWIPPSELRDQRELLRLRIFLEECVTEAARVDRAARSAESTPLEECRCAAGSPVLWHRACLFSWSVPCAAWPRVD